MSAGAAPGSAPGVQEKIGAIRARLNAHLKKLIDKVAVGAEETTVISEGVLAEQKVGPRRESRR